MVEHFVKISLPSIFQRVFVDSTFTMCYNLVTLLLWRNHYDRVF